VPNDQLLVGIEITRHCNLRCPHCFTDSGGTAHAGPSTDQLKGLLTELAEAGVRAVAFSGGEPLLRKDLSDVLCHASSVGIDDLGLVTNGYYANDHLVRQLAAAGLCTVQVSLDGVDAIDHGAVRQCGHGDFYRALRAIRLFKDGGVNVHVATIISPKNVQRAAEMALFCQALGVNGLRYCTFVPKGRGSTDANIRAFSVTPANLDEFIAFVQRLNEDPSAPMPISIDHAMGPWTRSGEFRCESGKRVAYISAEGDLYPCPSLVAAPFRVGNVFDTSVRDLLNSSALSAVRRIHRKQIQGPCRTCSNQACGGGCRGVAFAATGDVCGAIAVCAYARSRQ
jgi:radical SAM protein with 4Fe4S-binding SPASM domain